ncbi:MAG: hypothetical protein IJG63_02035 [Oscillospiraceae bacterium]|nr:hypothetical protein [Oscillospiraceae bacterium]MBQ6214601.1 hypothetical protein [Oscillospiraceae bacterium]
MKLIKENKYSKKLTNVIASILIASTILSGCGSVSASSDTELTPTPTVTEEVVVNSPIPSLDPKKLSRYYCNYYKISDEEVENRMENYNIKYKNSLWCMSYIMYTVIKYDNNIKLIPCIQMLDNKNNLLRIFDLESENLLYTIPCPGDLKLTDSGSYNNLDLTQISVKSDFLKDKEIIEYASCIYDLTFLNDYIDFFRERDGFNYYYLNDYKCFNEVYPDGLEIDNVFMTEEDLFKEYVKYVPLENQITAKEMGLEIDYPIERKYSDAWRISNEELEERTSKLNILNEDEENTMNSVFTLVLKDSQDNYKLMNVIFQKRTNELNEDILCFIDIYTGQDLFSIKANGNECFNYDTGEFENIDFDSIHNSLPYFDDKEICYLSSIIETNVFVSNHIEEFRERDNVMYEYQTDDAFYALFPRGEYHMSEVSYTTKEYASLYVRLPEEMIVYAKDLGLPALP